MQRSRHHQLFACVCLAQNETKESIASEISFKSGEKGNLKKKLFLSMDNKCQVLWQNVQECADHIKCPNSVCTVHAHLSLRMKEISDGNFGGDRPLGGHRQSGMTWKRTLKRARLGDVVITYALFLIFRAFSFSFLGRCAHLFSVIAVVVF